MFASVIIKKSFHDTLLKRTHSKTQFCVSSKFSKFHI